MNGRDAAAVGSLMERRHRMLYRRNMAVVILCALSSFWVLYALPLLDTRTRQGAAAFVLAHLALTAILSTVGVTLNRMASYQQRVTVHTVRAALRRTRRRQG